MMRYKSSVTNYDLCYAHFTNTLLVHTLVSQYSTFEGTVRRYGRRAIVHYFTTSEIITIMYVYKTLRDIKTNMACETKLSHARKLK